ncbi:MAG: 4Fe-4S binding protein, partial [Clostridium sp.]|nr:4Fe-4S binding protein [Clostridium sp.]
MKKALVLNIQKFSLHDGEGIRSTIFFKGCGLHCLWCHNPESQNYNPQLMIYEERCRGCGTCIEACPYGALSLGENGKIQLDKDKCNG